MQLRIGMWETLPTTRWAHVEANLRQQVIVLRSRCRPGQDASGGAQRGMPSSDPAHLAGVLGNGALGLLREFMDLAGRGTAQPLNGCSALLYCAQLVGPRRWTLTKNRCQDTAGLITQRPTLSSETNTRGRPLS